MLSWEETLLWKEFADRGMEFRCSHVIDAIADSSVDLSLVYSQSLHINGLLGALPVFCSSHLSQFVPMTIGHDSDDHQSVDEQTPLIAVKRLDGRPTPLPLAQLSILLFLQLAEPLTSQVIYPFAPQLIRDIGIAGGDEKKVGYYVGILVRCTMVLKVASHSPQHSAFFAAQAATILHWSRLSDYIGRKPVLMSGLFGISMTMYSFGLQRTYWGLVIRFVPHSLSIKAPISILLAVDPFVEH